MPTVSSEIFSVDTTQIRPAAEAFAQGGLNGQSAPDGITIAELWDSSLLNNAMMAVSIVLILIYLRRFITILPHIVGGIFRWKNIIELENNMRLSRERDSVALVSILISGVCISRLDLFQADFISALPPGHRTLVVLGIVAAFILTRGILSLLCPCRSSRPDMTRTANKSAYSFFIILTSIFLLLITIVSVSREYTHLCHDLGIYCAAFFWLLYMFRKCQIIVSDGGQFSAILYLCTMELLPVGLLVATMIYL